MMDWVRLTPAGEEDGDIFAVYSYADHRHRLNKAYQIYILDDAGIALSDDELAAIPPVKALVEVAKALSVAIVEWSEDLSDTNQDARLALLSEARAALAPFAGDQD
jgi:hypothetical protein